MRPGSARLWQRKGPLWVTGMTPLWLLAGALLHVCFFVVGLLCGDSKWNIYTKTPNPKLHSLKAGASEKREKSKYLRARPRGLRHLLPQLRSMFLLLAPWVTLTAASQSFQVDVYIGTHTHLFTCAYTSVHRLIHIYISAHVVCSIPSNGHSLIIGWGGAWSPLFVLLCLLGCASACAVLPFLHVVTLLAGLGASSGRFKKKYIHSHNV